MNWQRLMPLSLLGLLLLEVIFALRLGIVRGLSAQNLFLYALAILLGLQMALRPGVMRLSNLPIHAIFACLFLYALLTVAIQAVTDPGYNLTQSIVSIKNQIVDHYLFFLAFRYLVDDRTDFMWLARAVSIMFLAAAYFTVMDYLNLPNFGVIGMHHGRVEGIFHGANQSAALMAFFLPIAIALIPAQRGFLRLFWLGGVAAVIFLLVASGSRGAYVACVAGSFLAAWYLRAEFNSRDFMRTVIFAVILGVLAIIAMLIVQPEVIIGRVQKTFEEDAAVATSGRLDLWTASLRLMLEWPMSFITGFGWGAFRGVLWKSAHSVYVDIIYELGIIGLTLMLALLVTIVRSARKGLAACEGVERRLVIGFIFGFCSFCVAMAFSAQPRTWFAVWSYTGIVLGLVHQHISADARVPVSTETTILGAGSRA